MKFLNEAGQEITLKRSTTLPGYEVTLAEDTVIDSAVNNPFFKGINILQLPKKLKGFRDNPDLKTLLEPKTLDTGVYVELNDNNIVLFEPNKRLINDQRLQFVFCIFGNEKIAPQFINLGLKKVKLTKNTCIGTIFIINTNI